MLLTEVKQMLNVIRRLKCWELVTHCFLF